MLQTVKPIKARTGTMSCPLGSNSHHLKISCKKGLTSKQTKYVHSKCKSEGIIGSEQLYECESDDTQLCYSTITSHIIDT